MIGWDELGRRKEEWEDEEGMIGGKRRTEGRNGKRILGRRKMIGEGKEEDRRTEGKEEYSIR